MHRIKLNDRMTFPEELDMGSFIDIEDEVIISIYLDYVLRNTLTDSKLQTYFISD